MRAWAIQYLSGPSFLIVLAVMIGLGGGLGSWGFRELIEFFKELFLGEGQQLLGSRWLLPLIPATGGLIVGFIVLRWAPEAKGHGVPEVMAAVATNDGRIRPRVVLIKAFASAICIGSGGSVGREGPIVQIGSALGSVLAQIFRVSPQQIKILVGCGAAAGISATFNAPIAGAIFALEVILGDFRIRAFSPIIISSVLAAAFARATLGDEPAFIVQQYHLVSSWELIFYAILALVAGLAGLGFSRALYYMEDKFEALPISDYCKPVIGGLAVGAIAIFYPEIFGVGYEAITGVISGTNPYGGLQIILILLVVKFAATCLTLGSGGSGGVFAPSLFLGAMVGAAFGHLVNMVFPGISAAPGAYALVGMGAVVAGTTHAPLTAMLILFELTDDYKIILPLMLATTIATLLTRRLDPNSIYTHKLSRRGLNISQGVDTTVLGSIKAREVLNPEYASIHPNTPLGKIVQLLQHSEYTDFPVVDGNGRVQGMVSFDAIREFITDQELYHIMTATDVMDQEAPVADADATLMEVLKIFSDTGVPHLPIIAEDRKLMGVVTRARLMRRYDQELRRRMNN